MNPIIFCILATYAVIYTMAAVLIGIRFYNMRRKIR